MQTEEYEVPLKGGVDKDNDIVRIDTVTQLLSTVTYYRPKRLTYNQLLN